MIKQVNYGVQVVSVVAVMRWVYWFAEQVDGMKVVVAVAWTEDVMVYGQKNHQ